MTPRRTLAAVAGFAVVLLVAGLALALSPASSGWFAYAPLADAVYADGMAFVTPRQRLGWGLAVLGAVLVAGSAGYTLGRRTGPVQSGDGAR